MIEDEDRTDPRTPQEAVEFDGYGHVPSILEGRKFSRQKEAAELLVHRDRQAGIVGSREKGAESIVVSGGYEDDEDDGRVLIYTGHGGREDGRQIRDQKLTPRNESLRTSRITGRPVRVVRAINPRRSKKGKLSHDGYRYDGLYIVEDFWKERGRSGFLVYKSRLTKVTDGADGSDEELLPPQPEGRANPGRQTMTAQRIIRSNRIADWVKKVHDYTCQICGTRLSSDIGAYAEAAHIRPLGASHNGPDSPDNVLCLCPNHHVLFDLGMLAIDDDLSVTHIGANVPVTRMRDLHEIDRGHLRYHRQHHEELRNHLRLSRLQA